MKRLLGLAVFALAVVLVRVAVPQMTGGGRTAVAKRPLPPGLKPPVVRFEDLGAKAGLTGINVSGSDVQQQYIVENTGTGVAIFDYDNDGLPDLFFVNADRFEASGPPARHYLYHNLGGLRFEDVTEKAGITHSDWGQGVCAGDVDNDGHIDLFVTSWGHNVLWRNQGDGTFRDETKERGLAAGKRWSTGCAFVDYDRDGNLDLVVAHYLEFDPARAARPGARGGCMWKGFPVVCGPMGMPPETMSLYHNDGNGRFTDVSERSGIAKAKAAGLTVLTGDFDNDGWPDLYITGDSTASLHFLNKRNGAFEEVGAFTGIAYNEDGHEQSGMGAAAGDYDRDGLLDILKTNFTDDIPNLYRNMGKGNFTQVTTAAGLAIHTQFVSWGCAFVDFDGDGWKDIFIANGHVYPDIDRRGISQTFRQPRLLYWNRRDREFFDISSQAGGGIEARHSSRGVAVGDLDNDGVPEIVVVNMHEPPSLLKNFGEHGNSILVQVLTASGRDAIGARLSVTAGGKTQIDEVRSGGYYISQGDFRVHFGLGSETKADLSVRWPDGQTDSFRDLAAGTWVTVRQGQGVVRTKRLETAGGTGTVQFRNVAAQSGVDFVLQNHPTPEKHVIETMAGGVAAFDYDGDGLVDLFFANGASVPSLRKELPTDSNRLYRNLGGMRFQDVTAEAGLAGQGFSNGVAAADYDNDGHVDLFVTGVRSNHLYRNLGNGRFADVTEKAGIRSGDWTIAAAWLDYDRDGLLDLFVVNYLDWDPAHEPWCGDRAAGVRAYCHPRFYGGLANVLYRNRGDGTFADVSAQTGIAGHVGKGMSIAVADYDLDGYPDVFVTNDKVPNFLFHNLAGRRFEEVALEAGTSLAAHGKAISAMGADFRDYDNDGLPDIAVAALAGELYPLFRNEGKGQFRDVTYASHVGPLTYNRSGWSPGLFDFNNDGWKDLFVTQSHVNDTVEHFEAAKYKLPNLLLLNREGSFVDASAGAGADFQLARAHRGSAFADLNNDGKIDVVVSSLGEPAEVWENVSQSDNTWLAVKLTGTKSNRDGIGARVRVGNQWNHMTTSVGYTSSSHAGIHFGTGTATTVDVTVEWPSGAVQTLRGVKTNQVVQVRE